MTGGGFLHGAHYESFVSRFVNNEIQKRRSAKMTCGVFGAGGQRARYGNYDRFATADIFDAQLVAFFFMDDDTNSFWPAALERQARASDHGGFQWFLCNSCEVACTVAQEERLIEIG